MPEAAIAGMSSDAIRAAVRDRYGRLATHPEDPIGFPVGRAFAESVGYPTGLLDSLPATASRSFAGVTAIATWLTLDAGAVVVDLGCGAGLDTLLLARQVGSQGQVFGVDYSTDMIQLARRNAAQTIAENVTFIEAPVEDIPLPHSSVDAVVSNGIFNLTPNKERVISEIVRLLKPGAVLTAAEIVLTEEVPQSERATLDDWFRWIGGALPEAAFIDLLERAGLEVKVLQRTRNARTNHPATQVLVFQGVKPNRCQASS